MSAEAKAFWVEILSRHDEVVARQKVQCGAGADAVRIGRAYDNDIVLDDPFVAAHHLRIVRDASGALTAEDLGSANGLFIGQDRRRVPHAVLDGARTLRIGRTRLRIRELDHAVEPERAVLRRVSLWPAIGLVAGALLGSEALTIWLRETAKGDLGDYLGPLLITCVLVAAWTTVWAVLSRVFSGRSRFDRHLLIAVGGLLGLMFLSEAASYAAFAFSWPPFVAYRYVVQWLIVGSICFLHLRQVSQSREIGRSRIGVQAGAVAALALLAIGMQALWQWEASKQYDRHSFLRSLKPPALALSKPQDPQAFFDRVAKLKEPLDRARAEPPDRGATFAGDDGD